ncbi:MAG TPA: protein kinase [Burkholderiaceae bacterium]|jgi:serine/threonine protein kinase|nr:protein kinase [Burkholderiaceae bacterium]
MALEKLGRYEITRKIGEGAMGVVYCARDPLLDRAVAIKTIKVDVSAGEREEFERRFAREAKSVARLNHRGIVTIYDAGKADDITYMAMEYLQGECLWDIMSKDKNLAITRIIDIVAQVAEALDFAHQNGVVHRDVKPANIMVLPRDHIKVMDFGIASLQDAGMTMTRTVMGTPKYMAPEQIVGLPVDRRADIFSLGVVLYELLAGVVPFTGSTISTVMYSVIHNPVTFSPEMLAKYPHEFLHILEKALAKKVEDRYQSAAEIATDLRRYSMREEATILFSDKKAAPTPGLQAPQPTTDDLNDVTMLAHPTGAVLERTVRENTVRTIAESQSGSALRSTAEIISNRNQPTQAVGAGNWHDPVASSSAATLNSPASLSSIRNPRANIDAVGDPESLSSNDSKIATVEKEKTTVPSPQKRSLWPKILIAASVVIVAGIGVQAFLVLKHSEDIALSKTQAELQIQKDAQAKLEAQLKANEQAKLDAQLKADEQAKLVEQLKADEQAKADQAKLEAAAAKPVAPVEVAKNEMKTKATSSNSDAAPSRKAEVSRPIEKQAADVKNVALTQNQEFIKSILNDGEAALTNKRFREAMSNAKDVLRLDPNNQAAQSLLTRAKASELQTLRNEMTIQ